MANISRQPICSLQPKMQNTIIIGIVIRSQNSKIIDSARTRYNAGSRAVWNFTLRDSINDFINVTVWGTVDYVNNLFTTFTIGSVVEIINAKIEERKVDDPNEIYVPSVTSRLTLVLNQTNSLIQMHDSPMNQRYKSLLRIPTKNPGAALTLADVFQNADTLKDQFIDIIVIVTFVSQTREIVTRIGELTNIREFEVSDSSTDQTILLTLWDNEWIKMADKWEPRKTTLFLADAQVVIRDKMKKYSLTIARKTIITENPDLPESIEIRNAFRNRPDTGSQSPYAIPNPNSITTQMTIREITNRLNHLIINPSDDRTQLLVVLLAIVDDMNLDSNDLDLISARCAKCKRIVLPGNDSCMNLECPFGSGRKTPMNTVSLNVLINFKDDTGYLVGCRMKDAVAEQCIGCTAEALRLMPLAARKELKARFHKQLCDVKMQIIGPSNVYQKSVYNILSMNIRESEEDRFEPLDVDELELEYT